MRAPPPGDEDEYTQECDEDVVWSDSECEEEECPLDDFGWPDSEDDDRDLPDNLLEFIPYETLEGAYAEQVALFRDAPHNGEGRWLRAGIVDEIAVDMCDAFGIHMLQCSISAWIFMSQYDTSPTRLSPEELHGLGRLQKFKLHRVMRVLALTRAEGRDVSAIASVWKSKVIAGGYPGGGENVKENQDVVGMSDGVPNTDAGHRIMKVVHHKGVTSFYRVVGVIDDLHASGPHVEIVDELTFKRESFSITEGESENRTFRLAPCAPEVEAVLAVDTLFLIKHSTPGVLSRGYHRTTGLVICGSLPEPILHPMEPPNCSHCVGECPLENAANKGLFHCADCDEAYSKISHLVEHQMDDHGKKLDVEKFRMKTHMCTRCHQGFDHLSRLLDHSCAYSARTPCIHCGKRFVAKALDSHQRWCSVSEDQLPQCLKCSKGYRPRSLVVHEKICKGPKCSNWPIRVDRFCADCPFFSFLILVSILGRLWRIDEESTTFPKRL